MFSHKRKETMGSESDRRGISKGPTLAACRGEGKGKLGRRSYFSKACLGTNEGRGVRGGKTRHCVEGEPGETIDFFPMCGRESTGDGGKHNYQTKRLRKKRGI